MNDEKFAEADIYTAYKRLMELDQKQMFVVTPPPIKGKPKKKTDSDVCLFLMNFYSNNHRLLLDQIFQLFIVLLTFKKNFFLNSILKSLTTSKPYKLNLIFT